MPRISVNGTEYSFVSLRFFADGIELENCTSIDYKGSIERGSVMANGPGEVGRTRGIYKAEGNIEFTRRGYNDLIAQLRQRFPTKNPHEARFDIAVAYGEDGEPLITDELVDVQLGGNEHSGSSGSADPMKVKIPLTLRGIIEDGVLPFAGFKR
jgi:hypothetical protein